MYIVHNMHMYRNIKFSEKLNFVMLPCLSEQEHLQGMQFRRKKSTDPLTDKKEPISKI